MERETGGQLFSVPMVTPSTDTHQAPGLGAVFLAVAEVDVEAVTP